MTNAYEIIIRPIFTEKSMTDLAAKKYTFEVAKDANKINIKQAVEEIFGVQVEKVNVMNVKPRNKRIGKYAGRTNNVKKAIVTLTADSKNIEKFEI